LETVGLSTISRHARAISKNERHLDNASKASSHQGVTEHLVDFGTDHEFLGMATKGPACYQNDETRDKVALWASVTVFAEPYTYQPSTPPNYSHCRVLPVVPDPFGSPAMLCKGVDDAPSRDNSTVKELL